MKIRYAAILAFFILPVTGWAQSGKLKVVIADSSGFSPGSLSYKNVYANKAEMVSILNGVLVQMYDNAYLAATIDSVRTDSNKTTAILTTGRKYYWAMLGPGNVDEGWLSETGFHEKVYDRKPVNYKTVSRLVNKMLRYAEDHGYPFAQMGLINFKTDSNYISAELNMTLNQLILWDTIAVVGDTSVNLKFLANYLGIKKGKFYSETVARNIENRLKELVYIQQSSRPEISFKAGNADVKLYLKEQKASRFDGIVGLAPNSAGGSVLLTGEINLFLVNQLSHGEKIDVGAKRLQAHAEEAHVSGDYPYIFGLNFGVGGSLHILKFDTLYTTSELQLNLSYYLNGNNYLRILYGQDRSTTLHVGTTPQLLSSPIAIDYKTDWYGLGLNLENLDFALNPRKGYYIFFEGKAGIKHIYKDPNVDSAFYDSIKTVKVVYKITINANYFIPVGVRSTVVLGLNAGVLVDNEAFQNQLFRIGGFSTLRGFDESSIYASQYYIPSLEYRFLQGQTQNLSVFTNGAYYREDLRNIKLSGYPVGAGVGYSQYVPKFGNFSVSFAVRMQHGSSFDFNAAKIHVGYLNKF